MIDQAAWRETARALGANKLRSLLATLGVVIGSACFVLVVTVSLTAKNYIVGLIEAIGSNMVYADVRRTGAPMELADEISLADVEAVRRSVPEVARTAGSHYIPITVAFGTVERATTLVGVTAGFQNIRHLVILSGRYFDDSDLESHSKVCLVTAQLAKAIFGVEDPVDKTIRVGEFTFTVLGVFRERGATLGQSEIQDESILVPFPLIKYYTGADVVVTLYAQAARAEDVPRVVRQVAQVLRSRHREGVFYRVRTLAALLNTANAISLALSAFLLVLGCITLSIGGVNIMNIMLVTVTERANEIGLRRAVGASRGDIRYQFLLEAVLISGMGALAGVAIGVAIPLLVQPFLPGQVHIAFTWLSVFVSFGVCCLVGVVFGYLPADKAAKLQPTEALRIE